MTWSSDWRELALPSPSPQARAWEPGDLAVPRVHALHEAVVEGPSVEEELEAAYREGFDAGCAAGAEVERQQLKGALQALAAAARAAAARATPEDVLREHVGALAVAVAHHILGRELRGDQHVIADLVRRALSQFPLDEALRIRVHPQDLSAISTVSADGGAIRIAPGRDVEWVPDPELEPGECVVEGQRRIVDGRLDRALERIYRALTDA